MIQLRVAAHPRSFAEAAEALCSAEVSRDRCLDLCAIQVRLLRDGETVDSGRGSAAMGDPIAVLMWLGGALAAKGSAIKAGDLVMSGGLTRAHPVDAGSEYRTIFEGLGAINARFLRQAIQ